MKVIESIRYNRTGEVQDVTTMVEHENIKDPAATALILVAQAISSRNEETRRNLFTTTAIRVEF